jgi:type VI secretion system protein ImpC
MSTEQAKAATATTQTKEAPGLLEQMLNKAGAQLPEQQQRLQNDFKVLLERVVKPDQIIDKDAERFLKDAVAEIDRKLSAQLNEILHQPDFQKLEGTWRGLRYLVDQTEIGESLKIRVLNASKRDLLADFNRAADFDRSTLWMKIYEEEYGMLGGKPYGLLLGDYEFYYHPQDINLLRRISGVAAAAHAPFVAAASPKMFNLERFDHLQSPTDLATIFESADHTAWRSFREAEDSRYVALTLPRVLARLPYGADFQPVREFNYEENVDGRDHDKYLWMNAAWAYGARVTDAFAKDGWLARTRGVQGGGKVEALPVHTFKTDDGDKAMKCPSEIAISDTRELELSNLGFLPLLHCKDTDYAAFLGAQSCQKPKKYLGPKGAEATTNAALSAKLNYIMCVSRFSHYLKVMARLWIGRFMERDKCEKKLNEWIMNYVITNPENASDDLLAKNPLRAAQIEVKEDKRRPGWYEAIAYLRPHYQLEGLTASMRLVGQIPGPKT